MNFLLLFFVAIPKLKRINLLSLMEHMEQSFAIILIQKK